MPGNNLIFHIHMPAPCGVLRDFLLRKRKSPKESRAWPAGLDFLRIDNLLRKGRWKTSVSAPALPRRPVSGLVFSSVPLCLCGFLYPLPFSAPPRLRVNPRRCCFPPCLLGCRLTVFCIAKIILDRNRSPAVWSAATEKHSMNTIARNSYFYFWYFYYENRS